MTTAMISIRSNLLADLLKLRSTDDESLDEVLSRLLSADARATPAVKIASPTRDVAPVGVCYQLLGETHVASDASEAMINILRELAQYGDDFFPKLAPRVRGRTRNHIARSRLEVYPGRPDLVRHVKEVAPGWFIGCNIANREKDNILQAACDVMGLTFGSDLKIDLGLERRGKLSAGYNGQGEF
jgi:hypothetical protein